jgi:hypothetical protein
MLHNLSKRLCSVLSHLDRDGHGQDLLEWTVGLPLFLVLCGGIVFYSWYWWNQVAAAAAIHDGVYLAARNGGSVSAGYARAYNILHGALGQGANSYQMTIVSQPGQRSVVGSIQGNGAMTLPFVGRLPLGAKAQSYQRMEQFYGGQPQGWW